VSHLDPRYLVRESDGHSLQWLALRVTGDIHRDGTARQSHHGDTGVG